MGDFHGVNRDRVAIAIGLRHGVMAHGVLLARLACRCPAQRQRLPDVDKHGGRRPGEDELDGGVGPRPPLRDASLELPPRAVGHSVDVATVVVASPGYVADVACLERRDGRGGRRRLRDGHAAEDVLDGVLAELPVPGPEQADGAVHRVDHAAARLVEQRPEYCCNKYMEITSAQLHGAKVGDGSRRYTGARICTGSDVFGASGDEVDEAGAAVKLGEEDGDVALRVGVADPLQARTDGAVVAAPLPQHAASVAAHPHPESLITVCKASALWCVNGQEGGGRRRVKGEREER
jgi:hypothetical protein